jgi:hypothetical protein
MKVLGWRDCSTLRFNNCTEVYRPTVARYADGSTKQQYLEFKVANHDLNYIGFYAKNIDKVTIAGKNEKSEVGLLHMYNNTVSCIVLINDSFWLNIG